MENQITTDYFWGAFALPYINLTGTTSYASGQAIDKEQQELERYITKYQKEYLTKLFGGELIPDEVAHLVNDAYAKFSPITNYVFCKVLPFYQSRATAAGEQIKTSEHSTNTNYQDRLFLIWNDMVRQNVAIREVLVNAGLDTDYPTDYNDMIYKIQYYI